MVGGWERTCHCHQVSTAEDNGILLYNGDNDHIAVELYQGHVRVSYDPGSYPSSAIYRLASSCPPDALKPEGLPGGLSWARKRWLLGLLEIGAAQVERTFELSSQPLLGLRLSEA